MWDYQNQIPGESYQIMKEEKKCVSYNVNGLFAQSQLIRVIFWCVINLVAMLHYRKPDRYIQYTRLQYQQQKDELDSSGNVASPCFIT